MKSIGKYGHDSRKVIYVTQHTSWLIYSKLSPDLQSNPEVTHPSSLIDKKICPTTQLQTKAGVV